MPQFTVYKGCLWQKETKKEAIKKTEDKKKIKKKITKQTQLFTEAFKLLTFFLQIEMHFSEVKWIFKKIE